MAEIISFVSSRGGVGKTVISSNFAYILAKNGKKTLLIDCNIYSSDISLVFGIKDIPFGIQDVIFGTKTMKDVIIESSYGNLDLILSKPDFYGDRDMKKKIGECLLEIYDNYDYIVIDTPPILSKFLLDIISAVDLFFCILTQDPISVFHAFKIKKVCKKEGYYLSGFILNKYSKNGISVEKIKSVLGEPPKLIIPYEECLQNRPKLLVKEKPACKFSKSIEELFRIVTGSF